MKESKDQKLVKPFYRLGESLDKYHKRFKFRDLTFPEKYLKIMGSLTVKEMDRQLTERVLKKCGI